MTSEESKRILFVCLGNIVRSPLAENLFRHLAQEAGAEDRYDVDSAGTAAYHVGDSPDPRMRKVAAEHGLVYDGSGRQVQTEDFYNFDLIVAMDESNRDNLLALAPKADLKSKVRMMREFDPEAEGDMQVPDPYYGGIDGFEHVYQLVQRSSAELLRQLESGDLDLS